MTEVRLAEVVSEIIELLEQCGHADRAGWLRERMAVLEAPDSTDDAREHVRGELHGVVLGMGGLMDLALVPGAGSVHSSESARERLDQIGDDLYNLTR